MKQSTLYMINYLCMMLIAVTLVLHLATHAFLGVSGYKDSLTFQSAIGRYQAPASSLMLSVLVFALAYHTMFSFKKIMLEYRHGKLWDPAVKWGSLAGALVMIVFGMRTIVLAFYVGA